MNENSLKLKLLLERLCSTKEDNMILDNLCKKVESVTDTEIVINGRYFTYKKEEIQMSKKLPKSFIQISEIFSEFIWESSIPYSGFRILDGGLPNDNEFLFDDLDEEEINKVEYFSGAFEAGQNGMFFDLNRKLENGEMALGFIGHDADECVVVKSVMHLNYKQILLRLISDEAVDSNYVEEVYH